MSEASASSDPERLRQARARIDEYNRQDPNGREYPHSQALVQWVTTLRPDASEALLLAARAQHIGRWRILRDDYPRDRPGYLRWRKDLQAFHADEAAGILGACGYPQPFIDRVRAIIRKENLRADPETQAVEDALCLVFLERQLADFSEQHDEAKLQRIIRKTWAKMSTPAQAAALDLPLPQPVRALLERSLGGR